MADEDADPGDAPGDEALGHTPFSRGLALLAVVPAFLGLALGNPALLVLAAAPALVLAAARGDATPRARVRSTWAARRVRRGDVIPVDLRADLALDGWVGLLHQPVPDPMALEDGSNLRAVAGTDSAARGFQVEASTRGEWTVPGPTAAAIHPLLLAPRRRLGTGETTTLAAEPRAPAPHRVRGVEGPGTDPPGERRGNIGVESDDFRQLREYEAGDPLKRVNWKATARASTRDVELMVNEHEPEARQTVWFFLDLHPALAVGRTTGTALDDAVAACLALVRYYARRGHQVGGATYNGPGPSFHPEAGATRARAVARDLASVEAGSGHEGLAAAVETHRGHVARTDPAVFVVTRPEADPDGLVEGVRRLHALRGSRSPDPVTVLAPEPDPPDPAERLAARARARVVRRDLSRPGLRIRPLEDGARGLDRALAKGVAAP